MVVGAGFGGLGAALSLAERGLSVALFEALTYPGGCAATFSRGGARFEAGATLSSGLGAQGVFHRWIERYQLPIRVTWPDPAMTLRAPDLTLPLDADRAAFRARLAALPGAPAEGLARFYREQDRVAGPLWRLFDDPDLLPPLGARALAVHATRIGDYLGLLQSFGRTLGDVLRRHGVDRFAPLRLLLDALCQITVQCPADAADALFALPATDYPWRGTGHVHDGIGRLATGLLDAARSAGAAIHLADRVHAVTRERDGFVVAHRSGLTRCRAIVTNLLPADAARLVGAPVPAAQAAVDGGWGAAVLYRVIPDEPALPRGASHWMCVGDPATRLWAGNHVFASVSAADEDRSPPGTRTVTASTHVRLGASGPEIAVIHARMRETLAARAPELAPLVEHTASPRTFARFTRRTAGAVGGPPRYLDGRAWLRLGPQRLAPGVWMVGDSHFPGQSTLATAVGGVRVAAAVADALR